ncbi:reverse transcriptase domain-containing protein [Tanacetum coccineum]|uniref:Reverse transcriptase domain-containing protein n=1 Tax=Tanacetum coccineum TaxID=301880 RepID=A0ABQ5DVF6_9ASTR
MITTNSRIKDKKPLELILPTIGHLTKNCKTKRLATRNNLQPVFVTCNACGEKGHYANQCSKANNKAQESTFRDKLASVHFRISTLETTPEDI